MQLANFIRRHKRYMGCSRTSCWYHIMFLRVHARGKANRINLLSRDLIGRFCSDGRFCLRQQQHRWEIKPMFSFCLFENSTMVEFCLDEILSSPTVRVAIKIKRDFENRVLDSRSIINRYCFVHVSQQRGERT